jgi:hypothetical protein
VRTGASSGSRRACTSPSALHQCFCISDSDGRAPVRTRA